MLLGDVKSATPRPGLGCGDARDAAEAREPSFETVKGSRGDGGVETGDGSALSMGSGMGTASGELSALSGTKKRARWESLAMTGRTALRPGVGGGDIV